MLPEGVKAIAEITMTGLVALVGWTVFRKTIPGMICDFRAELEAERAASASQLKAFREELERERDVLRSHTASIERLYRIVILLFAQATKQDPSLLDELVADAAGDLVRPRQQSDQEKVTA